jgi:uncharacterized protein (DUF736 family)
MSLRERKGLYKRVYGIKMNCIFCKEISDNSTSIEHIIPESLGNKSKILEKGIVCDKCNNYFSTKIEKPLLDLEYFTRLRARNEIKSKKGRIPIEKVVFKGSNCISEIKRQNNTTYLDVTVNDPTFFRKILKGKIKTLVFPVLLFPPADNYVVSRFLAKVALEVIAQKLHISQDGLDYLVQEQQFDELREFARYGKRHKEWPYHIRKIYEETEAFQSEENSDILQDRLFEYNIFMTDESEYYFVLILKGIEYSINLGGPEIAGYLNWLHENDNKSPLYLE